MTVLRWVLGVTTFLAAGGLLLLVSWAGSYRRSWGASEKSGMVVLGPLLALMVLLATLVFPEAKMLLHLAAMGMTVLSLASLLLFFHASGLCTTILVYSGLWFGYYGLAAWAPVTGT
jgi:hypothetical protein